MKAILVLEDGTVYEGESIGRPGRALGEVVFGTAMVGYQQAITDPSFRGQILTFTYPLIGNYGTNAEDHESPPVQVAGLVVKELCEVPSNFRSAESMDAFLKRNGVGGIAGADTRALTRKLRTAGVMMGAISTDETPEEVVQRIKDAPSYAELDLVEVVSTPSAYEWQPGQRPGEAQGAIDFEDRLKIVALDYGIRGAILRSLHEVGCRTIVMPCKATADDVMEEKPDGVLLSPGPGDPERLGYAMDTVRGLLGRVPIFGICLGNHMLTHAVGGKTFKLKFGHRGGNHPVRDLTTGRVRITSQNHGFAADPATLEGSGVKVSQVNLNDGTVEGLEYPEMRAFSIQYHAEASPGPQDSKGIFKQFVERIREPERWEEIVPEVW